MRYELFISGEAREQLRELPAELRRNVGHRLQLLQADLSGDIKKIEGPRGHYRPASGNLPDSVSP